MQIGTRNLQLNHFEYRVEDCDVDLGALLAEHAVQQKLRLLAGDPDNARLRRDADATLRRGRFFSRAPRHRVTQRTTTTTQNASADEAFETFLLVQDSSGVQIGDSVRQENYFFSVIAPTLDAHELLRSDARLRASLIDQICGASTLARGADFPQRLSSALEHAVLNLPDLPSEGTVVDLRHHRHIDIRNEDGVSIGVRGRQRNDVSAAIAVPKALLADVASYTDDLAQTVPAQAHEKVERELARAVVDTLKRAHAAHVECWTVFDALDQTFPEIHGLVKRLRWGAAADLRHLRLFLRTAEAVDCSALRSAVLEVDVAVRAHARIAAVRSAEGPELVEDRPLAVPDPLPDLPGTEPETPPSPAPVPDPAGEPAPSSMALSEPDPIEPVVVEPDRIESLAVEPDPVDLVVVEPGPVESPVVEPDLVEPLAVDPGLGEPDLVEPPVVELDPVPRFVVSAPVVFEPIKLDPVEQAVEADPMTAEAIAEPLPSVGNVLDDLEPPYASPLEDPVRDPAEVAVEDPAEAAVEVPAEVLVEPEPVKLPVAPSRRAIRPFSW